MDATGRAGPARRRARPRHAGGRARPAARRRRRRHRDPRRLLGARRRRAGDARRRRARARAPTSCSALSDVVIVSERFPQRYTGAADLRSRAAPHGRARPRARRRHARRRRRPGLRRRRTCLPARAAAVARRRHHQRRRSVPRRLPVRPAAGLASAEPSLRFAAAAAALACGVLGGRTSVPRLDAVRDARATVVRASARPSRAGRGVASSDGPPKGGTDESVAAPMSSTS